MPLRAFNISALLLITSIVVQLALPFTGGGICALPEAGERASFTGLFTDTEQGLSPTIGTNDHTMPAALPELEAQTAGHGVATVTVWDPLPVMLFVPNVAIYPPQAVFAERLATNFAPLAIWRPPIPFLTSS